MILSKMRRNMKPIIIVVAVAFAMGLLYLGLPGGGFFGGSARAGVIATVNGEAIDQIQFRNTLIQYVTNLEAQYGSLPSGQIELVSAQLLKQLIDEKILLHAAKEAKIKVDKKEVDEEKDEFAKQVGGDEQFEQLLKYNDVTRADFAARIKEQLMMQKLLEQVAGSGTVTPEEVTQAYEEVHAQHILVRTTGDTEQETQAKAKIDEIKAKLDQGAEFAAVAKEFSEDPGSKDNGGDLGFISRGQTVPEFEKAAFTLQAGEVSDPVKSQFGYHLIKVVDRKEAVGEEFEKVKPEIEEQLKQAKQNQLVAQWFQEQKDAAKIEIHDVKLSAYTAKLEGRTDEALLLFAKAAEVEPNNGYLYASLGELYEGQGDIDQALVNFQKAAELIKTDASLYFVLGTLYQEKEDNDAALQAYQQAGQLDPDNFYLHYSLMSVYSELGQNELVEQEMKVLEEMQKKAEEAQKKAAEEQENNNEASQN